MSSIRFLIPLMVFLISCDAGTVEIHLNSFFKIKEATLPVFTDSLYAGVHDTLYLVVKDAILRIEGRLNKDGVMVKFLKSEGRPVILKDTIFLEHTSMIEVSPYNPVVINAISADVYLSKVHLARGRFEKSTLSFDSECDNGPLTLKESYVEIKMPASCGVRFKPEKGALLRGNIIISSLAIKRYRVDSATMYILKRDS